MVSACNACKRIGSTIPNFTISRWYIPSTYEFFFLSVLPARIIFPIVANSCLEVDPSKYFPSVQRLLILVWCYLFTILLSCLHVDCHCSDLPSLQVSSCVCIAYQWPFCSHFPIIMVRYLLWLSVPSVFVGSIRWHHPCSATLLESPCW